MPRKNQFAQNSKKTGGGPDDFICTAQMMKEIAGDDTLRFVLVGKNGTETEYAVTGESFYINGEPVTDGTIRVHISRYRKNFERFFIEAATRHGVPGTVVSRFYIAKLADMAGNRPDPIEISFTNKGKTATLGIRRIDKCPAFELDGIKISRQEGEKFIMDHYLDFITGYKKALSGRASAKAAATKAKMEQRRQRRRAAGISSQYVDGELKVNISTILNNEKEKDEMRRGAQDKKLSFADSFFKKETKRGYVPDDK